MAPSAGQSIVSFTLGDSATSLKVSLYTFILTKKKNWKHLLPLKFSLSSDNLSQNTISPRCRVSPTIWDLTFVITGDLAGFVIAVNMLLRENIIFSLKGSSYELDFSNRSGESDLHIT